MRIMGIDYGDSRIGIAVSDPMGWTAQGIETICWKGSLDKPVSRIRRLVGEYNIEKIIVGFPRNMDGTVGFRGEKTLEFIEALKKKIHVEIVKWDERLTTVAAQRTMHEMGIKTSKKKSLVDQIAATYILQGYLDSSGKRMPE
ncbi:MAG: Holliday junction resolvase RuvX [Clostridiales bacterium]|jgi:putative Holliday junction resolvase|nr:Holliday junction resolvase RuvX [Eubacteriales bacterium]MDH7567254.1 Holliday junction resolvase RuvX [Clostridiales bacterium]